MNVYPSGGCPNRLFNIMAALHCVPELGTLVRVTDVFNEDGVAGYLEASGNELVYILYNCQQGDEKGWLYVGTVDGRPGWLPTTHVQPVRSFLEQHSMTRLSRALSYLLRHGATAARSDAFFTIEYVLQEVMPWKQPSLADIAVVVSSNNKRRFEFTWREGAGLFIRASQGHSFQVEDALLFKAVTEETVPFCWHGTYQTCKDSIWRTGVSAMGRQHVHLTPHPPRDSRSVSGMRSDCNLFLRIDVKKAREAGVRFWRSSNDVILTRGLSGTIPPECFIEWQWKTP